MTDPALIRDRRTFPRVTSDDLQVGLRRRGHLGQLHGSVLDFNRHGVAVLMARPLPTDQENHEVVVSLRHGESRVDNIIGVVHTCFSQEGGFRCGIQFRTQSRRQFDREQIETALLNLESGFAADRSGPTRPAAETSASH